MRPKLKRPILTYVLAAANALCVILLCLYAAVHIPTFNLAFYNWQYSVNDTYNVVAMEEEELMRVTRHMLDYMRGRTPELQVYALVGGQMRPFFSEREVLHMVDVYELFVLGDLLRNIAVAWFVATLVLLVFMRVPVIPTLAKAYRWVIGTLIALTAALTALIAFDFDHSWRVFHEIFFDNDLWLLDPAVELLINIVPLPFFLTLSIFVGVIFLLMLAALFVAAHIVCKGEHRERLKL